VTGAPALDALRATVLRLRATPLPIDCDPACAVVLPAAATVDALASVAVRISPLVDGVPLAARCRLAQLPDSPTRGVVFVTQAEYDALRAQIMETR
jgi:hypothetical protein